MNIRYCYHGIMNCEPGYFWGPGLKEQYKIMFVHEGRGIYQFNGNTFYLEKGQGYIVFAGTVCYMKADEREPWVYSWIAFDGDQAGPLLEDAGLSPSSPIFSFSSGSWFQLYLDKWDAAATCDNRGELRVHSVLYQFLADWLEMMMVTKQLPAGYQAKEGYIRKALDFIHINYAERISISGLAEMIGIDRVYLSNIFKESMRVSPQQYLLQYRMDKACELLLDSELTVSEIARSVGYGDPLLFSKMFKKLTGAAPTYYRASHLPARV
ncbi:AraC family transcriptional regulator [Paenibacillus oryzae]|uniref:AraC family transcriptional regulator n=1 Tax=Paenibacillus oryzae TaxID=1844972 RepID=A0A1A5YQ95_9BACL|nr:AraC family transcriptional regulator [Paenibacillus oryzae]OBR67792.1 AraC family transcriptional regulator [Paenibacillus oryzae]